MNILDLLERRGITAKKKGANARKGDEYSSACPTPGCSRENGFLAWPDAQNKNGTRGSYWCRNCHRGGDIVQFLIDFDGLSYPDACRALDIDLPARALSARVPKEPPLPGGAAWDPPVYQDPEQIWRLKADKFAAWAHARLVDEHPEQMAYLAGRGLDPQSVLRWKLGWNPGEDGHDLYRPRESWGLPELLKENGQKKRLWMPRGLTIPWYAGGEIQRIRIRRPEEHLKADDDIRYYVVPGSSPCCLRIGDHCRAYVVVEAELDALLVDQEAGDLAGSVGMGSSSSRPDAQCHQHLAGASVILLALDFDAAGRKASWEWWMDAYPRTARRWPVPAGKDPGDAAKLGVDLRAWVKAGLPRFWHVGPCLLVGAVEGGAAPDAGSDNASGEDLPGVQPLPRPETRKPEEQTTAAPAGDGAGAAAADKDPVDRLYDLVAQNDLEIINTGGRLTVVRRAGNCPEVALDEARRLVFGDRECFEAVMGNGAHRIHKGNF